MVIHTGEACRIDGRLTSDALMDLFGDAGVAASVLLRGVEGFGARHRLRTDRLLSLSEDLPLVIVAVDLATRVVPLAAEVQALLPRGLVTLERVALPGVQLDDGTASNWTGDEAKLTVYCGRGEDHGGRTVPEAVADALRDAGLAGAIVLIGVDGVILGERRRARVLSRNRGVPAMVVAVGAADRVARALPVVRAIAGRHAVTLERVSILRRDGAPVGPLPTVPHRDDAGMELWQRLTVTGGEGEGEGARPFHVALIHDLRAAHAPGATALRGVRGHSGDGGAHAERLLSVRRSSPVLVTLLARPGEMVRLWPVVERATARSGLVTCELVPTVGLVDG